MMPDRRLERTPAPADGLNVTDFWELRECLCLSCGETALANDAMIPTCAACAEAWTRLPTGAPCAACGDDATREIGYRYFVCDGCAPRVAGRPVHLNALGIVVPVFDDPV
jgi:hypothetical protein